MKLMCAGLTRKRLSWHLMIFDVYVQRAHVRVDPLTAVQRTRYSLVPWNRQTALYSYIPILTCDSNSVNNGATGLEWVSMPAS